MRTYWKTLIHYYPLEKFLLCLKRQKEEMSFRTSERKSKIPLIVREKNRFISIS